MKWNLPPKIKIYEALGALGDGRLVVSGNSGKVFSSSGNKIYQVNYDPITNSIMVNDNASFYAGYLGYPAITYLMGEEVILYDKKWEEALKNIPWKDINQKNKNDFEKTKETVESIIIERGFDPIELEDEVENVCFQLEKLGLNHLGKKTKPPKGY